MTFDVASVEQSFRLAASELGMCDAAWRFASDVDAVGGEALVRGVKDAHGRTFPVLDAVFAKQLAGDRPVVDAGPVAAACSELKRLVVVGVEARWLDALVVALPDVELGVLPSGALPGDAARMMSNLPSRVALVGLDRFQRFAGPRSGLLTFVYGATQRSAFVLPEWVRAQGPDVRGQFRSFIGWNLLGTPPEAYPRWLIEVAGDGFTDLVTS